MEYTKKLIFAILIISLLSLLASCAQQQTNVEDKQEPVLEPIIEENTNRAVNEPEIIPDVKESIEDVVEEPKEKIEVTTPTATITSIKVGRIRDPITRNDGFTYFKIINIENFVVSSFKSTTPFRDGQLVNYEVTSKNDVLKVWDVEEEQITGFARPASYNRNRTSEENKEIDWTIYEETYNKGRIEKIYDNLDGTFEGFVKDLKTFRERKFEGITERFYQGDIVFYKVNSKTGIGGDFVLYEPADS